MPIMHIDIQLVHILGCDYSRSALKPKLEKTLGTGDPDLGIRLFFGTIDLTQNYFGNSS